MRPIQIMRLRNTSGGSGGLSFDAEVLADSPLAYFRLEEASGGDLSTISDSSGNANHCLIDFVPSSTGNISDVSVGPISGFAGFARGHNYNLPITGGGDVIVYDTTPATALRLLSGGITFEWMWIRNTAFRWITFNGLSNGGTTCYFELRQDTGATSFEFKGSGGSVWASFLHGITDTSNLHHCVLTISAARSGTNCAKLYVDGALVAQASPSSPFTQSGTGEEFRIGSRPDQLGLKTCLYGLAIYNSELSAARVSAHWAARNT